MIAFISGHLDLTPDEFEAHYRPRIDETFAAGAMFLVGDARGADTMAQAYLHQIDADVLVFHMFEKPRNNVGSFVTSGGFTSDDERDMAMTAASTCDIAWVRPGRERSGTARNMERRSQR